VLCSNQFLKTPWISFSSFKIKNKANQFYEALQKNDIDKIDNLVTDNVENQSWMNGSDQTKKNFLDNLTVLKNKRVEYTSFKAKQFYYVTKSNVIVDSPETSVGQVVSTWPSRSGFVVAYELCFKDYTEKACNFLIFQLDENDKHIFISNATDSNLLNAIYDKYNPSGGGNAYYNKLHLFVDLVFNGHSLESIKEGVNNFNY
jgi:ketosteroid isomerase-like protein